MLFCSILPVSAQEVKTVTDNENSITVDVTVFDVKKEKAAETAVPYLSQALFFRGLSDSFYCKSPLAGTDESFMDQHPQYFNEMFENGRFLSFISSSRLVSYNKKAKPKEAVVRFVVNIKALRLDLETQGVRRRFGF